MRFQSHAIVQYSFSSILVRLANHRLLSKWCSSFLNKQYIYLQIQELCLYFIYFSSVTYRPSATITNEHFSSKNVIFHKQTWTQNITIFKLIVVYFLLLLFFDLFCFVFKGTKSLQKFKYHVQSNMQITRAPLFKSRNLAPFNILSSCFNTFSIVLEDF